VDLIPAADVDKRETVIQQPPHLPDRRVAFNEDATISELQAAERTLPPDGGFGSRQACGQEVVAQPVSGLEHPPSVSSGHPTSAGLPPRTNDTVAWETTASLAMPD
jgi:hypothetical protein